jgi:hypothetical protein
LTLADWTVATPLVNGTNVLTVTGIDHSGQPIPGDTGSVSVVYRGTNAPSLAYIDYNQSGLVYTQNFDGLPDPGATSVDADNPVTISNVTYSLGDPFNFALPALATGDGGLGVTNLAGWYGYGVDGTKFGATDGDQTTGGQNSFGTAGSSNRALGLLATSSTAGTAFGARFLNDTAGTLNAISVQLTGEVWRQSNLPKTLQCYYFIDPTGTNTFPTNLTAYLPALNVSFPTNAAAKGGVNVNGTLTLNQTNLAIINQTITNWPAGTMLWLAWQMTDDTGKAQGLAIDNLSFAANVTPPALNAQISGNELLLNWQTVLGQSYQIEYKNNLTDPVWTPLGAPISGTDGFISISNNVSLFAQRFFRIVAQ